MKRIAVVLPVLTQPRYIKRTHLLKKLGFAVTVYYFARNYFQLNKHDEEVTLHKLGTVEDLRYYRRIPTLLKSIGIIRKDSSSVVYAFSVDTLFLAIFSGKSRIIYEIGDFRQINFFLFRYGYRRMLKKCSDIIVTSRRFRDLLIDRYRVEPDKVIVHPNLLERDHFPEHHRRTDSDMTGKTSPENGQKLAIGVIGLLRYDSAPRLLAATRKHPHQKVLVYGKGILMDEVRRRLNPEKDYYGGEFRYPDDLYSIYDQVDINFVMYDTSDINVRCAIPNKLYESVYFATPLIVSSGTYLGEIVSKWGIGLNWDYNDIDGLCAYLNTEAFRKLYAEMVTNLTAIPGEEIYQTNENLKSVFS